MSLYMRASHSNIEFNVFIYLTGIYYVPSILIGWLKYYTVYTACDSLLETKNVL